MSMTTLVTCEACAAQVPQDLAWRGVRGYDRKRASGGSNHIALRRSTDDYLCDGCMRKRQHGISTQQTGLI